LVAHKVRQFVASAQAVIAGPTLAVLENVGIVINDRQQCQSSGGNCEDGGNCDEVASEDVVVSAGDRKCNLCTSDTS
jgi:hypothetical protein